MKIILTIVAAFIFLNINAQRKILTYEIFDEINSTSWLYTQGAFRQAEAENADCVILHLNTYGGEVVYADSIRTKILNSKIPVYVFIDNNAASAGALISIACDSIFMRQGGNIGAATVVSGTSGEKMPDKYQSYMRSTMRSTAEAHGKIREMRNGVAHERWFRNPTIAEAMVDERIYIKNIVDSTQILTFTTDEAIANGYCEGKAETIADVASVVAGDGYTITEYRPSALESAKGFLLDSALRSILILIIIGGIYFELQTPGVGIPILASIIAALLYFAPLYIDGLAANWEIALFVVGLALVALEVFVIPGFGVAGIAGILCIIGSLAMSMMDNDRFDFETVPTENILRAFATVSVAIVGSIIVCIILGKTVFRRRNALTRSIILDTAQNAEDGFVGIDTSIENYIGRKAKALTPLRPSGKVSIDGKTLDAITEGEFISKGAEVVIKSVSSAQVVVSKSEAE